MAVLSAIVGLINLWLSIKSLKVLVLEFLEFPTGLIGEQSSKYLGKW